LAEYVVSRLATGLCEEKNIAGTIAKATTCGSKHWISLYLIFVLARSDAIAAASLQIANSCVHDLYHVLTYIVCMTYITYHGVADTMIVV
jgi:hypothetical protein